MALSPTNGCRVCSPTLRLCEYEGIGSALTFRFGIEPLLNGAYLPDLVVFLNPAQTSQAVRECILRNIPTVGIVDSDTDPRFVTYPIPANSQVRRSEFLWLMCRVYVLLSWSRGLFPSPVKRGKG